MTPDLTTPEGRAELRALIAKAQPGPYALDAAHAAFEGRPGPNTLAEMRERMVNDPEYRADFWRRVAASEWNKLDAAYAQIERLTAPVTENETLLATTRYYIFGCEMAEVLDAFIASRKEPAP